jgi:hypothetical protein
MERMSPNEYWVREMEKDFYHEREEPPKEPRVICTDCGQNVPMNGATLVNDVPGGRWTCAICKPWWA